MQASLMNAKTSEARRRSDESYRSFVEDSEFLQDMDSSYDAKSTTSEEAVATLTPSSAISSPVESSSTSYRQHSPKGPPSISRVLNSPLSAAASSQSDVYKTRPPPLQAPFNYRKSSLKLRSPPETSPISFVSPLSAPSSSSTITPSFSSPRKTSLPSPRVRPKSPKSPRKHRLNALSDSPLPDSPTIPTAGSSNVPSLLNIPPSFRPTSPKRIPRKENAQKKRFTRTLGHISAFIPINVCISESLTMAVTVEKTKTVEQLARQIEAEYTFKHYDVDGPDLTPLEVGLLYDEGMVSLRFRDVVGDILDVGTTVHVLNVYENEDDSEKTPTSSAHSLRTSSISAMSLGYAPSERSRRRSSLPVSLLMTPSMLDALPPSPPPLPSVSMGHGRKPSAAETPPRLVRSLSQSDISLYANSDHLAMAGLDTRFRDILSNTLALRYFARFSLAEFSIENLLFYIDVELFSNGQALAKDLDDEEFYDDISRDDPDYAASVQAEFIYVCYIADSAPLQVNLPDEIRRDIMDPRELLMPDRTMFDEAQEAVYQLMKGHTYVRFETHEMHKQLSDIRKNDAKRFRSKRIPEDDYIHTFQPNIPMMLAMCTTLADPNTVVSAHYREQVLTSALSQYFPEGDPLADIPPSPAIVVDEGSRPPSAGADVATIRPAPSPVQSEFSVSDPDMQPREVEGYFEEDNHMTTAQKVRKIRRRKKLQWIFGETVQGTRNSTPGSAYSAMSSSLDLQDDDEEDESDDTDGLPADIDEQDSVLRHRIAKQIFEKKRQMDKVEAVLGAAPGRISEKGRSSSEDHGLPSPKLRLGALKHKKKGNEEIGIAYSDDTVPTARRIAMNRASHLFEPSSPGFDTLNARRVSKFPTTQNDLSADQRRLLWKKNRKLRVLLGQVLDEDVVQSQLTRAAFEAPEQFEKGKMYEPSIISNGSISIKNVPAILGHSPKASKASIRPTLYQIRKRRSSDPQLYSSSPSPTKSGFDDIAPPISSFDNSGRATVAPVPGYGSSRDNGRARPLAIHTAPSIESFGTLNTDGTMMSAASNASFRSTERLLGELRTPHSPTLSGHRYTHSQPIYLSSAPSPRMNDSSSKMFTLPEIEQFPSLIPFSDQPRNGQTQVAPPSSPFESEAEAKDYRRRKMEKLHQFYGERVPMSAAGVPLGSNEDSSNRMRYGRSQSHSGGAWVLEGVDEYAERGRGTDTAAYYSSMVTSPVQGEHEHKDKDGLFNRWRMRKKSNTSPSRGVISQNSAHSTSSGSTASAKFDTWRSTDSLWQPNDALLVRGDTINAEQERQMRSRFLNATPRKLTRKTSSTSTSPILQMGGIGRSPGGQ